MSIPESYRRRLEEKKRLEEKADEEKLTRIRRYNSTGLRVKSTSQPTNPSIFLDQNADNFRDVVYSSAFVTLQNTQARRTSYPGTEYIVTYGPIPTITCKNPKDLPVFRNCNEIRQSPNMIAIMYGQSLLSKHNTTKTPKYFNAPYLGDLFDQFTTSSPFYPSDPYLYSSHQDFLIDASTLQISHSHPYYKVLELRMRKPEGLDEIVYTGDNDELRFLIDLGYCKLV